jgi:hypothetical protein
MYTTLRPGLLVRLATSIKGNVSYAVTDLGKETDGDTEKSRWQTDRTIADKAELERATKARSKARSIIAGVCSQSEFGLLCLQENKWQLDGALAAADEIARQFNKTSSLTVLRINALVGTIAPDDARAIRAINNELSELMANMQDGMARLDVEAIRDAANRARSVSGVLTDEAKGRVKEAIDIARKTAREIVKAAEIGAAEVDQAAINRLNAARTSFLDLDESAEPIGEVQHEGRTVDLEASEGESATTEAPEAKAGLVAAPAPQGRLFEV